MCVCLHGTKHTICSSIHTCKQASGCCYQKQSCRGIYGILVVYLFSCDHIFYLPFRVRFIIIIFSLLFSENKGGIVWGRCRIESKRTQFKLHKSCPWAINYLIAEGLAALKLSRWQKISIEIKTNSRHERTDTEFHYNPQRYKSAWCE